MARKVNETISYVVEGLFGNKTVKAAMSVLGTKSGEVRADKAAVDDAAQQVLDSPKLAALKVGLSAIGIDLDSMVEQHGPQGTISALLEIGSLIGITPETLLSGQLGNFGGQGQVMSSPGTNPHLKT